MTKKLRANKSARHCGVPVVLLWCSCGTPVVLVKRITLQGTIQEKIPGF